ncbi:MAG TPA: VOC family protein [Candidatus Limnocylindria bacterium]|nr:VOC family protein [Candidatus Limnocylindria bacterium]
MERVTGIGGVFIRARDPAALAAWYAERLGITVYVEGCESDPAWWPDAGPTVFAPFPADTDYFGRGDQQVMLNYRVTDLDRMLDQLRSAGVDVLDEVQEMAGIGRFAWATDPEGNRFELWQPAPEAAVAPGEPR